MGGEGEVYLYHLQATDDDKIFVNCESNISDIQ